MNKASLFCCLFWLSAAAYNPGPSINEYANNPITPGYGISNYFELMPETVKPNKAVRFNPSLIVKNAISVKFIGKVLHIDMHEYGEKAQLEISIFNISGKKVFRAQNAGNQKPGNTVLFPFPKLPKGVYFVSIRYAGETAQIKLIYTGK
jgi:hypothetical protein